MSSDIFDHTVICKDCDKAMEKVRILKNGFYFRVLECKKCDNRIVHPEDKLEYQNFLKLRNKQFNVKLRMVGNSYTVSIPREIVNFINEQDKIMDEMVKLSFERMGKLVLIFNEKFEEKEGDEE
ncbi:hypothetical protein COU56_00160 [Candidatus Pacearchaeota archaeon CG10_big_fil_rev_8_21_14_0_10_31_9]|nr:MAG: hypothetical protein AUJ62_03105 [Candidatus Pacearchaeota archaeon CG1_02_32_21]PIN96537.1 MAG: hypothetical protein COU56_00160 [Candidatus Pacearchaeota archaeon CG10_big_fil_rev_8_21_14_0_10_31_9]